MVSPAGSGCRAGGGPTGPPVPADTLVLDEGLQLHLREHSSMEEAPTKLPKKRTKAQLSWSSWKVMVAEAQPERT